MLLAGGLWDRWCILILAQATPLFALSLSVRLIFPLKTPHRLSDDRAMLHDGELQHPAYQVGVDTSIAAEVTPPVAHHLHHSSLLLPTPTPTLATSPTSIANSLAMPSTAAQSQGSRGSSSLPTKKSVKHLTCYFWHSFGSCRYTGESCLYAHHHTGVLAAGPVKLEHGRTYQFFTAHTVALTDGTKAQQSPA